MFPGAEQQPVDAENARQSYSCRRFAGRTIGLEDGVKQTDREMQAEDTWAKI